MPQSQNNSYFPGAVAKDTNTNTPDGSNDGRASTPDHDQHHGEGIMKTVTVLMNTSNGEDREDSTSATGILRKSTDGER